MTYGSDEWNEESEMLSSEQILCCGLFVVVVAGQQATRVRVDHVARGPPLKRHTGSNHRPIRSNPSSTTIVSPRYVDGQ